MIFGATALTPVPHHVIRVAGQQHLLAAAAACEWGHMVRGLVCGKSAGAHAVTVRTTRPGCLGARGARQRKNGSFCSLFSRC